MGFIRLIDNLYAVDSFVLVWNIDFKSVLISRIVFRLNRKIVLSGFSFIQEKLNRVRCPEVLGFVFVAGLGAFDRGNLNTIGIGADNRYFIWQYILGQLVVIHSVRCSGLFILAENIPLTAVIEHIVHLQRDIVSDVQNDFKVSRMPVCKGGNRNPIGIGGFPLRHFHIPPTLSVPTI